MDKSSRTALATYGLGTIHSIRLLPPPRYNKYEVVADAGRYFVCKRGLDPVDRFAFFHELVLFLMERGFPTPRLIQNVEGQTYHPLDGWAFELWEWVDGVNCRDSPWNRQELGVMGQMLAQYHQTVESFVPTIPRAVPQLDHAIDQRLGKIAHRPVPASILTGAERILSEYASRFARLPKTVIHGDVWQANFLRDGHRWWLVDYEWSQMALRLEDVANGLRMIPSIDYQAVSIPDFQRLLSAYLAAGSLSDLELECLPAFMQTICLYELTGNLSGIDEQLPERQWTEQADDMLRAANETALLKWMMDHEQELHAAVERARLKTANSE